MNSTKTTFKRRVQLLAAAVLLGVACQFKP